MSGVLDELLADHGAGEEAGDSSFAPGRAVRVKGPGGSYRWIGVVIMTGRREIVRSAFTTSGVEQFVPDDTKHATHVLVNVWSVRPELSEEKVFASSEFADHYILKIKDLKPIDLDGEKGDE